MSASVRLWSPGLSATIPPEGRALTNEQIRTYVKQHLSRFAVPRETVFLDELPRNAVGKVVPRHLPKPWENTTEEKAA